MSQPRPRPHPQQFLDAVLRSDLSSFIEKTFHLVAPNQSFVPNWHIEAIAWRLQQCLTGEVRRLIITMPPRQLKSISASVAFPAFALGRNPTEGIVCVSYSAELAAKHTRDCRAVMDSLFYRRLFSTRLSREKNTEFEFLTTNRGSRLSTSVGGTLTGRGGNLIIIDDPMKPEDAMSDVRRQTVSEWYQNTLYSRLDDKKNDVIILIMQRLHMDDLVGHVLAKEDWVRLNLPAISDFDEEIPIGPTKTYFRKAGEALHEKREPLEVLAAIKRTVGSFVFSSQYQQAPIPPEGELIKMGWFRVYVTEPARADNDQIVQSWDTASKPGELNDYSVCTTWLIKGKDYYLLDVFREKLIFPDLKRAIYTQAQGFRPNSILIEDKASGTALIQDLQQDRSAGISSPIAIEPEGDKLTRASAQSSVIEAGQVHIPRHANWLGDLRNEILQFPNGRYDDQVDSITQFLKWVQTRDPLATSIKVIWPT